MALQRKIIEATEPGFRHLKENHKSHSFDAGFWLVEIPTCFMYRYVHSHCLIVRISSELIEV